MQYMKLDPSQREAMLVSLAHMSDYLADAFADIGADRARVPGPDGQFSPVEQVWHLADLERDGFGERIRRLLLEAEPHLADFDGTKIAAERNYRSLSLDQGLVAFAQARRNNIEMLRSLLPPSWQRSGFQEGVGKVSLCDMPSFMAQHDAAHRSEIEAWKRSMTA